MLRMLVNEYNIVYGKQLMDITAKFHFVYVAMHKTLF